MHLLKRIGLLLLAPALLLTACADRRVTVRYNRFERATVVSSGDIPLEHETGPMHMEMSYGSPGKVVRKADRILVVLTWEAATFLPEFGTLLLRGNGKKLETPVAIRSRATRMSEVWDVRASCVLPLAMLRQIFPMGSSGSSLEEGSSPEADSSPRVDLPSDGEPVAGPSGAIGSVEFKIDPSVSRALDEILAKRGVRAD